MSTAAIFYVVLAYTLYLAAAALYNITIHPLAKFPGPKLRGTFNLPQYWDIYTGETVQKMKELHDTYGDTVRIAPKTLSYTSSQAWKVRYMWKQFRQAGNVQRQRVYYGLGNGVADIISPKNADHSRMRRLLSHAFSDAALREQEQLITHYLDHLIEKLHQQMVSTAHKINFV